MIKTIRNGKATKVIAIYLVMMIFLEMTQPMVMFALTSGPKQPEFNAFTPISTSDMVDLTSGDFNYNIPIMDVGGYPLNLAYNSGVTMDQESSWVGLGWNLNVGQIERQVRGMPDDFKGDEMRYENKLKDNITVGTNFNVHGAIFGHDQPVSPSFGIGVQYNNYEGITFKPSYGISFALSDQVSVGANFSSSVGEGASVSPEVTLTGKEKCQGNTDTKLNMGFGVDYNSRKGLESFSASVGSSSRTYGKNDFTDRNSKLEGKVSLNNTTNYTPTKRVANDNANVSFSASIGTEFMGPEVQGQILGYASVQKINSAYKNRKVKAYGYEYTEYKGTNEGVLDFNREKESSTISKNTTALPVTNYTYDTYSIDGQGVSGMFRPFRSQVTYVYNDKVTDIGAGVSLGLEIGGGNLVHWGGLFTVSPSTSTTGKWISNNNVLPLFSESNRDKNPIVYESSALKLVGEMDIDPERNLFNDRLADSRPIRIKLHKSRYNNKTLPFYQYKNSTPTTPAYADLPIASKIKRKKRLLRNQIVQKVTDQAAAYDPMVLRSGFSKSHHTAGIKVMKTDGSTYVYGQAVYNTKKVECTFDVSGKSGMVDHKTGVLSGITGTSGYSSNNSDKYLNKITTPPYAHSFLLTSVLSTDYEDVDNNGPSENDLGSYTKFEYEKKTDNYKWRVPFISNTVSFNEGLKSNKDDEKGNYLYGEKELVYIKRIVTKTHVAIFSLSPREDGLGATSELVDPPASLDPIDQNRRTYKIDKIDLYSLEDAKTAGLLDDDPINDQPCIPIKTAHFKYNYTLCKKIPSSTTYDPDPAHATDELKNQGKLTLEKVYFTYRNSNMGKYTPYVFDYAFNPNYHIKGYDIWGNYKPINENITGLVSSPLTNSEFPFVKQDGSIEDNKNAADLNTSAWTLKSIRLPSGGTLTINTESDDYKYVQNKKAMQMFKVVGAGNDDSPGTDQELNANELYNTGSKKYIYVDLGVLDDSTPIPDENTFKKHYLSENEGKPIYFKFLLNMASGDMYDYVTGYFEVNDHFKVFEHGSHTYVSIPLKFLPRDGGISGGTLVNPISKAGWGFGRTYLNRVVYSLGGDSNNTKVTSILLDLVGSIAAISELWKGPNKVLQDKGCAQRFISNKSWIRLENPVSCKFGGGLRVKSVELSDNWNAMTGGGNEIYNQKYGQEYDYKLEDEVSSSGVATYEPNASPENALIEPFYQKDGNYADRIASPKDQNYVEKPFGESFYPSPKVTYSRVTVSNIKHQNGELVIKKHATGKVVTEHYTSHDFPTLSTYTDLDMTYDKSNPVLSFLNILSINHLVASQGFSIETNDMDGKVKSQKVYAEDQITPISGVDYKYNLDSNGKLSNDLVTINSDGSIATKMLGVQYDVINDFNENNSTSSTVGVEANLAAFIAGIFPCFVPTVLPTVAYHENVLKTAVTTKVVYRTGVLKEKIAYDLGSHVSTENMAWDAQSGQVILTKTVNEYDDFYYSLNYPAYWAYDGMGLASNNIGLSGIIRRDSDCPFDPKPYFKVIDPLLSGINNFLTNVDKVFHIGDELYLIDQRVATSPAQTPQDPMKVWVAGFNTNDTNHSGLLLMDKEGKYIDNCGSNLRTYAFSIVRSGYRNMQEASMASITLMTNPIDTNNDGILDSSIDNIKDIEKPRVINASAVEYKDFWKPQNEGLLKVYPASGGPGEEITHPLQIGYNPYLWNAKGDWRANRSYAYLTGRESDAVTTRKKGYFKNYYPFYTWNAGWIKNDNDNGWEPASTVTQYSPYGMELENADALDRYSSAQYGYNHNLPMAIASNSTYAQMGFEGFEESDSDQATGKHFEFLSATPGQPLPISTTFSHTGKKSVKVLNDHPVKLVRKLSPLVVSPVERPCTQQMKCEDLVDYNFTPIIEMPPPGHNPDPCSNFNDNDWTRIYKITSRCGLPIKASTDNPDIVTFDSISPTELRVTIRNIEYPTLPQYMRQMAAEAHPDHEDPDYVAPLYFPTLFWLQLDNFTATLYDFPTYIVRDEDANGMPTGSTYFLQCLNHGMGAEGTPYEPCCRYFPGRIDCENIFDTAGQP